MMTAPLLRQGHNPCHVARCSLSVRLCIEVTMSIERNQTLALYGIDLGNVRTRIDSTPLC